MSREAGPLDELGVGRQQRGRRPSRAPLCEPARRLPLMARTRSMARPA